MKRILFAVLGVSLLTASCSDPVPPAAPTPAAPTITDMFSDTLLVLGTNTHQFTVGEVGGVKVTLNSVDPSAAVGIGVGAPTTGACTVLSNITAVGGAGVQLSGTATVTGTFCLSVYDVGNLVEPVTYTITVLHS